MVRYGQGAFVGIGFTNAGTDATNSDIKARFKLGEGGDNLGVFSTPYGFPDITDYDLDIANTATGQKRVTGSVRFPLTYNGGFPDLLRLITGDSISPSGTPFYTYAFTPEDPSNTNHYLYGGTARDVCIEVFRNDSAGTSVFYQGCQFTEVEFAFASESFATCQLTVVGRDATESAKSTSPTFGDEPLACTTGQTYDTSTAFLRIGSSNTAYRCSQATLTIAMPTDLHFGIEEREAGLQAAITGRREVRLNADVIADDTDSDFLDMLKDPVAQVQDPVILHILKTAGEESLTINLQECTIEEGSGARASNFGPIRANLSMMAHADAATSAPAYDVSLVCDQDAFN